MLTNLYSPAAGIDIPTVPMPSFASLLPTGRLPTQVRARLIRHLHRADLALLGTARKHLYRQGNRRISRELIRCRQSLLPLALPPQDGSWTAPLHPRMLVPTHKRRTVSTLHRCPMEKPQARSPSHRSVSCIASLPASRPYERA